MKKYITLTLEVESKSIPKNWETILKQTIEDAFETEFFIIPRSGKIVSFEVHEATDFDKKCD